MTASARKPSLLSFDHGLVPAIIAFLLYFAGRAPFLGQWDSFDYVKQIVTHRLSDLGFGRPVFIGYNIVLWETTRKILGLAPLQVESVVMLEIIFLGSIGVFLFRRLLRQLASPQAAAMSVLAFMLSPVYTLYSGYIMTEVPMLVTLLAAGLVLWNSDLRYRSWRDVAGGVLFGVAFGIREQALTLAGAFLWILWVRRSTDWRHSVLRFSLAAMAATLTPVIGVYAYDPASFLQRVATWIRIIPKEEVHLWKNIQASLLWTFLLCPAAWLATLGAAAYRLRWWPGSPDPGAERSEGAPASSKVRPDPEMRATSNHWGLICSLILPLVVLWGDADVQIHPRYALIVLPASVILCATLYHRWAASARAAVIWALLHLVAFGVAQIVIQPFRQLQYEKKQYAFLVREKVPGQGLLIAGGYSPIFDYYRALGDRPHWHILWSGWGWSKDAAAAAIKEAWKRNEPVYLCDGPYAWLFFEDERLDLHHLLYWGKTDVVAPGLVRAYPRPPVVMGYPK